MEGVGECGGGAVQRRNWASPEQQTAWAAAPPTPPPPWPAWRPCHVAAVCCNALLPPVQHQVYCC